jgi:transcriptional regulator with XRE-family HTH domain
MSYVGQNLCVETLGELVKRLRLESGMSYGVLARKIGVHEDSIANLEKGRTQSMKSEPLLRLAELFGEPVREWIRESVKEAVSTPSPYVVVDMWRQLSPADQEYVFVTIRDALKQSLSGKVELPPASDDDSTDQQGGSTAKLGPKKPLPSHPSIFTADKMRHAASEEHKTATGRRRPPKK